MLVPSRNQPTNFNAGSISRPTLRLRDFWEGLMGRAKISCTNDDHGLVCSDGAREIFLLLTTLVGGGRVHYALTIKREWLNFQATTNQAGTDLRI